MENKNYKFGISINNQGKIIPLNQTNEDCKIGDIFIVETNRGIEFGEIKNCFCYANRNSRGQENENTLFVKKIIRKVNAEDLLNINQLPVLEKEYKSLIQNIFVKYKVENLIKICHTELIFDKSIFYVFYKEIEKENSQKIPLKEIMAEARKALNCRVNIEAISERNLAKMLGGVGVCGYQLCCCSFIKKWSAISVKFAREQGLAINLNKLTGECNKLKCCLKHEKTNYDHGKLDPGFYEAQKFEEDKY